MPERADNKPFPLIRSRIAPTPSGYLHRGNGFSFVLTWLLVRNAGGKLLLRIDDADTTRARPEYLEDIFYCLDWLGLDWDEGPAGPDDFHAHYTQQLRFPQYQQMIELLVRQQQVYACNCSRSQIREHYEDGVYKGNCRSSQLSLEAEGVAWRVQVPDGAVCFTEWRKGHTCLPLGAEMGDFVVRRKEGLPAYQIASLADDIACGVNFVVRGEDLLYSTAAQVYLASLLAEQQEDKELALGAQTFQQAQFLHHSLVQDTDGSKLSKSAGSTSLKSLREAGGTPIPVYALVADYLSLPADAAASLHSLQQALKEAKL